MGAKITFEDYPEIGPIAGLKNHRIPNNYRVKGASSHFLYKKI